MEPVPTGSGQRVRCRPEAKRLRHMASVVAAAGHFQQGRAMSSSKVQAVDLSWTRTLVSTDLMLGCAFNSSNPGVAAPDQSRCIATVMEALRYNFALDTAPSYRESEEHIGKALASAISNGAEPCVIGPS